MRISSLFSIAFFQIACLMVRTLIMAALSVLILSSIPNEDKYLLVEPGYPIVMQNDPCSYPPKETGAK